MVCVLKKNFFPKYTPRFSSEKKYTRQLIGQENSDRPLVIRAPGAPKTFRRAANVRWERFSHNTYITAFWRTKVKSKIIKNFFLKPLGKNARMQHDRDRKRKEDRRKNTKNS